MSGIDENVTEMAREPTMPAVGGPAATGPTYRLFPVYVVLDESHSMEHEIATLNEAMEAVYDKLVTDPHVCDVARLSMIAFSDTAEVVLPLSDLTSLSGLPKVSARASTSYAAAFDRLAEAINTDVPAAKQAGYRVLRPAVFMLTDGKPSDPDGVWQAAWDRLLAGPYPPNVISFGFRDATEAVLEHINTVQAYIAAEATSPAQAISQWAEVLLRSVVTVSQQAGSDQPAALPAPPAPAGSRALMVDPV